MKQPGGDEREAGGNVRRGARGPADIGKRPRRAVGARGDRSARRRFPVIRVVFNGFVSRGGGAPNEERNDASAGSSCWR